MKRFWLIAIVAAFLSTSAIAQNTFPSQGGARVPGAAIGYIDAGGKWQQITVALPLPVTGASGGGPVTAIAGAFVDGSIVNLGSLADAACATDNGSCSLEALIKRSNQRLTTIIAGIPVTNAGTFAVQEGNSAALLAAVQAAIPAGTNLIGKVGIDQTTPGTTNGVALEQIGSTTVDGNSGVKSNGTLRVVLATDQPQLTNRLLVTPDAGSTIQGVVNTTPTNCGGTVATGGTAVNAFTANAARHGFTIANIDTSEVLWISFTTTALASDTQSYPLAPATATTFAGLSSYSSPIGFGMNTALSVVAATNGHKFACTVW